MSSFFTINSDDTRSLRSTLSGETRLYLRLQQLLTAATHRHLVVEHLTLLI
jgi:hypothetical protein